MTGQRLDRYLSARHPDISRARWQEWIAAGQVRVNGQPITKPAYRLRPDDMVDYTLPPDRPTTTSRPKQFLCPSSTRTTICWW
jgi:23S rRNA pseudouridine1911/1915/1917 synthase